MSTLSAGGGNSSARFTHVYSSLAIPFPGSWYACLSLLRHQFLFVARSQTPVHDGMDTRLVAHAPRGRGAAVTTCRQYAIITTLQTNQITIKIMCERIKCAVCLIIQPHLSHSFCNRRILLFLHYFHQERSNGCKLLVLEISCQSAKLGCAKAP